MTRQEFRNIRLALGLTQGELAEKMGLGYQTNVSRIENKRGPTNQQAAHIRLLLEQAHGIDDLVIETKKEEKKSDWSYQ